MGGGRIGRSGGAGKSRDGSADKVVATAAVGAERVGGPGRGVFNIDRSGCHRVTAIVQLAQEVYAYRELLLALTYRDIRVKYKQALFGVMWVFFMPVLAVSSGIVFRAAMAFFRSGDFSDLVLPDIIGVMVKSLPWLLFASVLSSSSSSLLGAAGLITKIYFPREVIPFSAVLSALFDFAISITGLCIVLVLIGVFSAQGSSGLAWHATLWLVPPLMLTLLVMAVGLGLLLGAGNLFFRDVKYLVSVATQFGLFFSLVYFKVSELGQYGWVFLFNPVTPVLEALRMAVVEGRIDPGLWPWLGYSAAFALAALFVGARVFEKAEYLFAEYA